MLIHESHVHTSNFVITVPSESRCRLQQQQQFLTNINGTKHLLAVVKFYLNLVTIIRCPAVREIILHCLN